MWLLLQIVGVIFPVMIMALVPIRQYIMPRMFSRHSLHALDAAEYEAAPPGDQPEAAREAAHLELAEQVCCCCTSLLSCCGNVVMMLVATVACASRYGACNGYYCRVAWSVGCFDALRLL